MNHDQIHSANIAKAAAAIRSAEALLIGTGAGMGVDSGLPVFRGPEGFWKAYPPFHGKQFAEISTPHWFKTDPQLAWGFFGHRLNLYRNAIPHGGFAILLRWSQTVPNRAFVFTSNVDGQFQKAGFAEENILERHGSIHYLQCRAACGQPLWSADGVNVIVDEKTFRATSTLPSCPSCGAMARPNILMFGDRGWDESRANEQAFRYEQWLLRAKNKHIVAIEIGAGLTIPTVRVECEMMGHTLIRINPSEPETPPGGIPIQSTALQALEAIDAQLHMKG